MAKLSSLRTLVLGALSPLAAAWLGMTAYRVLTRASENRDQDFVFRLSVTALAMTLPFVATFVSALFDRHRALWGKASQVGLAIAILSLGLLWLPIRGAISRAQQAAHLALEGVQAPDMETTDVGGNEHRLSDHHGKVVLLNIWATWCPPCKKEMPDLDRLYQDRKDEGLMVFGLSTEDVETQREFATNEVSVSYPLLTVEGDVPEVYRTTARYPANFLIDRQGRLQRAPSTEQPFENLVAKVDELLDEPRPD